MDSFRVNAAVYQPADEIDRVSSVNGYILRFLLPC
jgi:hypothetical protein